LLSLIHFLACGFRHLFELLPRFVAYLFWAAGLCPCLSLQGPLPVPVPRVALGVPEPIESLGAGTPTNQPYGIPTPHRALSVGLPLLGGAPPILPIKRVKGGVRGGRLGLGGEEARAHAAGRLGSLGFEGFGYFDCFGRFMDGGICASLGRSRLWVVARLLFYRAPTLGTSHRRISIVCSLSRCRWLTIQAATPLPTLTGWIIPKPPPRLDRGGLLGDSSLSTLFCSLGLIRL
jgi:hypothetical protein